MHISYDPYVCILGYAFVTILPVWRWCCSGTTSLSGLTGKVVLCMTGIHGLWPAGLSTPSSLTVGRNMPAVLSVCFWYREGCVAAVFLVAGKLHHSRFTCGSAGLSANCATGCFESIDVVCAWAVPHRSRCSLRDTCGEEGLADPHWLTTLLH